MLKNLINKILNYKLVKTYDVLYAPEVSRNPDPVQVYRIIGHPSRLGWRSKAGHKLFTAIVLNRSRAFSAFRADRVLSVKFSGLTFVSSRAYNSIKFNEKAIQNP